MSFQIRTSSCVDKVMTGEAVIRWLIHGGAIVGGHLARPWPPPKIYLVFKTRVERWIDPRPRLAENSRICSAPALCLLRPILPAGDQSVSFVLRAEQPWYPIEAACAPSISATVCRADCPQKRYRGFRGSNLGIALLCSVAKFRMWRRAACLEIPGGISLFSPLQGRGVVCESPLESALTSGCATERAPSNTGRYWLSDEHHIVSPDGRRYRSEKRDGVQHTDYLLITALPRAGASPERMIIFWRDSRGGYGLRQSICSSASTNSLCNRGVRSRQRCEALSSG